MRILAVSLLVTLLAQGCGKETPAPASASNEPPLPAAAQPRLRTMRLWLGSEELVAELALTDAQRQAGMMFRTNMAENEGMLFVFPVPHQTAFWMKNTSVPLSVAYIDPFGVIQEIHELEPHNTNSVVAASDQIQYVLETTKGWFQRHNIGTGTVVRAERGPLNRTFGPAR